MKPEPEINELVAVKVVGHVLRRTSPKGTEFVGECMNCGAIGLASKDALAPCSGLTIVSLADFITGEGVADE